MVFHSFLLRGDILNPVDRSPYLDKLQRGMYPDMSSCSAANGENLDMTAVDRHVSMRFRAFSIRADARSPQFANEIIEYASP